MSLINQMLQDLDARSSQGLGVGATNGQIRAVPKKNHVPAIWAGAAVVVIALLGLGGWLIFRPAPTTVVIASVPVVPKREIKLETALTVVPLPVAPQTLPPPNDVTPSASARPAPPSPASSVVTGSKAIAVASDAPVEPAPKEKPLSSLSAVSPPITPAPKPVVDSPDRQMPVEPLKPRDTQSAALPKASTPKASDQVAPAKIIEPASPVTLTKQVKDLTPGQRAENEFRRATVLVQQARGSEAIPILEQTLLIDPQHASARQTLVALLINAKRSDDAVRHLQDGLKSDSTQAGAAMILARLQIERGEQSQAVATLQRTLPYGMERADYQSFLAALLQRENRHKEAAEHYMSALRKAPQNGLWWMGLGISLQADSRTADAHDAFTKAKASNTLTPELQAFVDQRLQQLGR